MIISQLKCFDIEIYFCKIMVESGGKEIEERAKKMEEEGKKTVFRFFSFLFLFSIER